MAETKFGKRIRSIRQNAECSQKEFCTVLDIPQSTIGPIPETGAVSEIFELANFLRPVALLTGALGIALSTFRLIRKILFPS